MSGSKTYATHTERQAAYRGRPKDKQLPREATLAHLARSLQLVFEAAVKADQRVLAPELLGKRADATLRNLIHYIYLHTDRGQADPVWNSTVSQ